MKKLILLSFCLLISQIMFAGKDKDSYSPGTLILRTGDTLNTMISLGNFADLRLIITKEGKKKTKYKPGEIVSLEVDNRKFISQPVRLFSLSDDFKNDGYVLLEELVKGEISLYKLDYCYKYTISKDSRAKGNMTKCNMILYLLSDIRPYYFEVYSKDNTTDAMSMLKKNKQRYSLNEVAGYFEACEEVSKLILYERVKRENIYDAVIEYNKCMAEKIPQENNEMPADSSNTEKPSEN